MCIAIPNTPLLAVSRFSLDEILAKCQAFHCKRICLTGGEPLAQPNAIALMKLLLEHEYEISLETSGALSVADVPVAVSKVMEFKKRQVRKKTAKICGKI